MDSDHATNIEIRGLATIVESSGTLGGLIGDELSALTDDMRQSLRRQLFWSGTPYVPPTRAQRIKRAILHPLWPYNARTWLAKKIAPWLDRDSDW